MTFYFFLRRGQVCFTMHLYGPHIFVWKKCREFQTTFSPRPPGQCCPNKPWSLIFAQIISDERSTKIAKMMVLRCSLNFLRQVQICFHVQLYGSFTFIWEKMLKIHILDIFSKDYVPFSWNLCRSIGAPSRHRIVKRSRSKNQRRPPQPHSRKAIFNLFPNLWSIWAETCPLAIGRLLNRKKAKIVSIENLRWPPQPPSWKSVLDINLQTKRRIKLNLTMLQQVEV